MDEIITYEKTENLFDDVCRIIDDAQRMAYQAVNITLVMRNWYLGRRIADEDLNGENRAEYGAEIIDKLSMELAGKYGKGYTRRALYQYVRFYRMFPEIVYSPSTQFDANEKVNAVSTQSELLSWTHYRVLIQVEDEAARKWYAREAYGQMWSYALCRGMCRRSTITGC